MRHGRTPTDSKAKPRSARGCASSLWTRWLTPRSQGFVAICRRISASIWSRPGARLPQPAGATKAKLKAFARALLSTRLDRSSARVRTIALGLFVAYAGLGVKLLVLGLSHDPPQTLKTAADDAVSGARPDLLDRNGEILATDVKTMSVFAEPNRIIDMDEAVELITAVLPDVDAKELRERLASKKGFIWVKRQITPKEQAEIFHLGLPGVGFLPENKRVYPNGPIGAHVIGYRRQGQCRHRRHGEISRPAEPDRPACRGLHGRSGQPEAGPPVARSQGDARAARRTGRRTGSLPRQGGGGHDHRRQHRRSDRARIAARLRSQRSGRRCKTRARSTASMSASTKWARPSRRFRSPWRSNPARSISARMWTRATACATGASRFTISTPPIAC